MSLYWEGIVTDAPCIVCVQISKCIVANLNVEPNGAVQKKIIQYGEEMVYCKISSPMTGESKIRGQLHIPPNYIQNIT